MSRQVQDGWVACPPGELGRLSSRLWARRVRRTGLIVAGIVLAVAALTLGAAAVAGKFGGESAPAGAGSCGSSGCAPQPSPCSTQTPP